MPWYISRGNHDGLVQGNAPASTDLFRAIAIGCLKVFPSAARRSRRSSRAPRRERASSPQIADPAFIQHAAGGRAQRPAGPGPPDHLHARVQGARSAARTATATSTRAERRPPTDARPTTRSAPRKGIELISLDTVAEGGGQSGNLDDPQYSWLETTLKQRPEGAAGS